MSIKNRISMKRIFSAFCILIISVSVAFSQFEDGYYRELPELDKYTGTWQWQSGDSVLKIKLVKTIFNLKQYLNHYEGDGPDASVDVLIGWHEFRNGATVIQSSMSSENSLYDYKNINQTIVMSLVYGVDDDENSYELLSIMLFHDLIENVSLKNGSFKLTEPNQAILSLVGNREGKFSLPKKVLMTKIE